MQENVILIKKYGGEQLGGINENEVWRYAGYLGKIRNIDSELKNTLNQVEKDLSACLSYRVCYRRIPITWEESFPILPFPCKSKKLADSIKGSGEIIIFAATIGLEIDRYIARNQKISPSKALLAQAYGAERIEELCESFCNEIKEELKRENLCTTKRFSPGYGDLPLETQVDIFKLLDCSRQIGVSLNESLLMSPSKSVTAVFGIKKQETENRENICNADKCLDCNKSDCGFRRRQSK